MSIQLEQEKWKQYYAAIAAIETDEDIELFNRDFSGLVDRLLPGGGDVLEAGCGAGVQSLALARLGKFKINLLDFSDEALKHARRLFRKEKLAAKFMNGDMMEPGEPQFDLVFNLGVLEHYTFEEQVALVRGMASRSRGYVLAVVPNQLCYWYWLWRIQAAGAESWEYGKEVPACDLTAVFKAAGLETLGNVFMGEAWTAKFIQNVLPDGHPLLETLLKVHGSPLLPLSERAYLAATLGRIPGSAAEAPAGWHPIEVTDPPRPELIASLGDALALNIAGEHKLARTQARLEEVQGQAGELLKRIADSRREQNALEREKAEAVANYQAKVGEVGELLQKHEWLASQRQALMQKDAEQAGELERLGAEVARLDGELGLAEEQKAAVAASLHQLELDGARKDEELKELRDKLGWLTGEHQRLVNDEHYRAEEIQRLGVRIDALVQERSDLLTAREALEAEIQRLLVEDKRKECEIKELLQKHDWLAAERLRLLNEEHSKGDEADLLRAQFDALMAQRDQMAELIWRREEEAVALRGRISELEGEQAAHQVERARRDAEARGLDEKLAWITEDRERLLAGEKNAAAEIQRLMVRTEALAQEGAELRRALETREARHQDLALRSEQLAGELRGLAARHDALAADRERLLTENAQRAGEVKELLVKVEWLGAERERALQGEAARTAEWNLLRPRLAEAEEAQKTAEAEKLRLAEQLEQAAAERGGWAEQQRKLEEELRWFKEKLDASGAERTTLDEARRQLEGEANRLRGQLDVVSADRDALYRVRQELEKERLDLRGHCEAAEARRLELDHQLAQAGEALEASEAACQSLQEIRGRLEEEIESLDQRLKASRQRISELGDENETLRHQVAGLNGQVEELMRQVRSVTRQAAEYEEQACGLHALLNEENEERRGINEVIRQFNADLMRARQRQAQFLAAVKSYAGQMETCLAAMQSWLEAYQCSRPYKLGTMAVGMRATPILARAGLILGGIKEILGPGKLSRIKDNGWMPFLERFLAQLEAEAISLRGLQLDGFPVELDPLGIPDDFPVGNGKRPAAELLRELRRGLADSGDFAMTEELSISPEAKLPCLATFPLVSVMLPVYNHADMLPLAVETVRKQTYPNWELIILDDGSKDNIDEVLERFADDPRIRIYRQENQRLPNGLTNLHALARGEFMTWTSADNLMAPAMLDELVAVIAQDPDLVMVYADTAVINESGEALEGDGYRDHNRDPRQPERLTLTRHVGVLNAEPDNFINACFLYRTWAQRAIGDYASDLNGLEDYDFFLRLRKIGKCRHIGNDRPLYCYRVHVRTMSEDLLTKERDAHINRGQMLIDYDQARMRWVEKRWTVEFSPKLDAARRARLEELLELHPVNFAPPAPPPAKHGKPDRKNTPAAEAKRLCFIAPGEKPGEDGVYVVCAQAHYLLLHIQKGKRRELGRIPVGEEFSLLAVKCRQQINRTRYWEFAKAGRRRVVGTHISMADVDAEAASEMMAANPDVYFVIFDDERQHDTAKGERLAAARENCCYIGPRKMGYCYFGYSDFEAVFCPPCVEGAVRTPQLASMLAFATGRYLLYPGTRMPERSQPYTVPYHVGDPLPAVWALPKPVLQDGVLDAYFDALTERGGIARLLRFASGALQEAFIPRPDFGQYHPRKAGPKPWAGREYKLADPDGKKWVGLWIDTLDRGGLEEIVALLAHEFRRDGVAVRILCSERGGLVSRRLESHGFRVEVFNNDADKFSQYLKADRPVLLSSHFVHGMLAVPAALGIPVVETIHNMFAHFSPAMWGDERKRFQNFTHAIAVSKTVREYYLRWLGAPAGEKITVINNAAASARTVGMQRPIARKIMGYDENELVYLNLASFDGRKNQLGLLTAFDRLHAQYPATRLILMGNEASPFYFGEVKNYLDKLMCREAVRVVDFQHDVGSVLAAADAFVIASYIEGWSVSATEAAYSGLPLIHTECGSGPELCAGGRGILVPNPGGEPLELDQDRMYRGIQNPEPPNTPELIAAMERVYQERHAWQAKRPVLRTTAVAEFTIRKMVAQYLELFEKVEAGESVETGK